MFKKNLNYYGFGASAQKAALLRTAVNQFLAEFYIYCPIFFLCVKYVCLLFGNFRNLNLLETQEPVHACNWIPLLSFVWYICFTRRFGSWFLSLQHMC